MANIGWRKQFLSAWDEDLREHDQTHLGELDGTAVKVLERPPDVPVGARRGVITDEDPVPTVTFGESVMVALSAGLGYGFDAYAVNIYGLLVPVLLVSLHVSLKTLGNIGSLQLIGYTLGTIGFGWAADRWGRKSTLGVSILSYGATTALGGAFSAVVPFAIMRFLTGVGGAGELAVGAPYTTEVWPKRHRALGAGGIIFSLYSLGYIVAGLVALFVVGPLGWRWPFYLAVVPAVAVFALRCRISESPRYIHAVAVARRRQAEAANGISGSDAKHHLKHIWATGESRKRVALGSMIYIANACGYWAIALFLTTFIVKEFHESARFAILWAIIFYVVQFFLSYVGTILADRVGRRPAAILGSILIMLALVVAAKTPSFTVFLVFMGLAVGMLGWLWGIGNTYVSELFPTHLRGTGFGWCVGIGRTASIFAPALVAYGIATLGARTTLIAIAPLFLLSIAGYLLGPETANEELEVVSG